MSLQQCAQFPDASIGTVAQNRVLGQKGRIISTALEIQSVLLVMTRSCVSFARSLCQSLLLILISCCSGRRISTALETQSVLLVSHWYSFRGLPPWDWERKTIHIAVMDRLVSGHRRDLKDSVGLKRPLKWLHETFQNDPRQKSPE